MNARWKLLLHSLGAAEMAWHVQQAASGECEWLVSPCFLVFLLQMLGPLFMCITHCVDSEQDVALS